jgi:hypothetical protein
MADWKMDLDEYFTQEKKAKKEIKEHREEVKKGVRQFMKKKALPAFEDLKDELKQYKRDCEIDEKKDWAALMVRHNKKKEFVYAISLDSENGHMLVNRSVYSPNEKGKLKLFVEGKIPTRENSAWIDKTERIDIIADFLETYKQATRSL